MNLRKPQRRTSFTMVEMLVVVAIIGLLAAFLLPQLSKTLARAKQAKSLSNLRQIGVGVASYVGDHDGRYPVLAGSGWNSPYWSVQVSAYLPGTAKGKDAQGNAFSVSPVMLDPLLGAASHNYLGDYGANSYVFADPTTSQPPVAVSALTRMSSLVTVTSAGHMVNSKVSGTWYIYLQMYLYGGVKINGMGGGSGFPDDRKTGSISCLYADGHTDTVVDTTFDTNKWSLLYPFQ